MKTYFTISALLRLICAGLLFWALKRNPYSYYTILRWMTCFVALYTAVEAYRSNREAWTWLMGIVAALFNPLVPIGLDRRTWAVVDIAVGVLMLASIFIIRTRTEIDNRARVAGK
jgi:hypothetical protein